MKVTTKFILLFGTVCFVVGLIGTAISIKEIDWKTGLTTIDIEKKMPSEDINKFSIETDIAGVIFIPSNTDEIKVHLTGTISEKRAKKATIEANNPDSNTWHIKALTQQNSYFSFDLNDIKTLFTEKDDRIRAEVTLPQKMYKELRVKSDTGSLDLINVLADSLQAQTSTGSITINKFEGNQLELQTDTGRIQVDNALGNTKMSTSTGGIALGQFEGSRLDIETDVGRIEVHEAQGDIRMKTSTGSINAAGLHNIGKTVEVDTDTGSIDIKFLSPPRSATFLLSSDVGRVTLDVPEVDINYKERNRFKGTLGDGKSTISVVSRTGQIDVR